MTKEPSVSLNGKQRAFARTLAENGGHTNAGALLEEICDLLRGLLEREQSKRAAPCEPPSRGPEGELVPAKRRNRRVSRPTTAKRRSHGPPSRVPR